MQYSYKGLYKASLKFNPSISSSFSRYASFYVVGELYRGMTELQPISKISAKQRRLKNKEHHVNEIKTRHVGLDTWLFDLSPTKYDNTYFQIQNIVDKVERNATLIEKRVFNEKYSLSSSPTNLSISQKLNCSEENVRKTLNRLFKKIQIMEK